MFASTPPPKAGLGACTRIQVPVPGTFLDQNAEDIGEEQVEEAVRQGFDVVYNQQIVILCNECETSGGKCGSNATTDAFLCYCRARHHNVMCPPGKFLCFLLFLFFLHPFFFPYLTAYSNNTKALISET